jgi:hypothetical protein
MISTGDAVQPGPCAGATWHPHTIDNQGGFHAAALQGTTTQPCERQGLSKTAVMYREEMAKLHLSCSCSAYAHAPLSAHKAAAAGAAGHELQLLTGLPPVSQCWPQSCRLSPLSLQ